MSLLSLSVPPPTPPHPSTASKGLSESEPALVSQNGAPGGKKLSLPELEYREKGREGGRRPQGPGPGAGGSVLPCGGEPRLQELESMENHVNHSSSSKRLNNELEACSDNLLLKEDAAAIFCPASNSASAKNYKNSSTGGGVGGNSSPRSHSTSNGSVPSAGPVSSSSNKSEKKQRCPSGRSMGGSVSHRDPTDNCIPNNQLGKPDALVRLEQDVKRLKADLQASRQVEQELRGQIGSLSGSERSMRSELGHLRQENELLQNKLHSAVQAKQKDRQAVGQLEKRLKQEQEARAAAEKQLAEEKKRKKAEEATAARAVALAAATRGECTESLRSRIRELEAECKRLTVDIKLKEEQIRELDLKVQELRKYKEMEKDTEVLMSALSAMQDKTQHLENSLSAETRIKLDLFSALGDAKRQLEIAQGQIAQKEQEIKDLKQKMAEVMAVMPSLAYSADSSAVPHYSSTFMDNSPSSLDPNASVYQPLSK
ncbi:hypothetical protein GJAV_G00001510 [Gymnothorax javanicus]|nr:hypothetical protein GJAV_G00001510 [Gymnothorax javanicus]